MEERALEELRLQQASTLVEIGIVDVPAWMPAIVDSRISPIPVLTQVTTRDQKRIFVGWIYTQDGRTSTRRWPLLVETHDGEIVHRTPLTPKQTLTVMSLLEELRSNLTERQLEGWE